MCYAMREAELPRLGALVRLIVRTRHLLALRAAATAATAAAAAAATAAATARPTTAAAAAAAAAAATAFCRGPPTEGAERAGVLGSSDRPIRIGGDGGEAR